MSSSDGCTPAAVGALEQRCDYCARPINGDNDDFLKCQLCQGNVHIKCLRHASTPGDLLGDVFFDFTCCNCNDDVTLQFDGPSTSSSSTAPREQLVRQRLPWLIVITLALHNLSLKSKGLSHHGYFHWRTHIVSFIDKNWDYLFEPRTRRRKKWIGSVSGALSHNSPEFFSSGQEVFHEAGWWKLTNSNHTPKMVFKLYGQQSLKRQQMRNDKRCIEDSNNHIRTSGTFVPPDIEAKRLRRVESDEESFVTDSCSRTIPYMGRKPKISKQLKTVEVDVNKNIKLQKQKGHHQQEEPLNTVQSSLMDFLAENLASEDLMFHDLPNIAAEPIVSLGKNDDDLMQLIGNNSPEKNIGKKLFDEPSIVNNSTKAFDMNSSEATTEEVDGKLKSFYLYQKQQQRDQKHTTSPSKHSLPSFSNDIDCASVNIVSDSNDIKKLDNNDSDDSDEDHKPRIVQVTNYQQKTDDKKTKTKSPMKLAKQVKKEIKSEAEGEVSSGSEMAKQKSGQNMTSTQTCADAEDEDEDDGASSSSEDKNTLAPCKPSLFTKRKIKRDWPWLAKYREEEAERYADNAVKPNERIVMMSEFEEQELLEKLQQIFSLETTCNIEIPSYVRRFYRKLCVRAWKREHSKPLFNLDEYLNPSLKSAKDRDSQSKSQIIDKYRLLAGSSTDARSSFYARIAGSFQYELFESPYTQRVLHPFIYRSKSCLPPWLKLMCELQYTVNGTLPKRSCIDYCYVRPNHIAAVNALLQTVFWPGIDMSDCLSYPDFSVVALYKKLVIGCGFLVPDVSYNEAYISFMAVRPGWQRSGIATFMLYHLIQTCMSKDITLHVSATNPAVVLYQKFGFKIEEVILDFYEKYLPHHSKHSRHAFFLRLLR